MAIQSKPRAPHGATEVGAEADSGVHHEDFPALVTLDVSYRRITEVNFHVSFFLVLL